MIILKSWGVIYTIAESYIHVIWSNWPEGGTRKREADIFVPSPFWQLMNLDNGKVCITDCVSTVFATWLSGLQLRPSCGCLFWFRWRKERIWSERPITICAIVKGWTRRGFLIWHQREVTREQGPIRSYHLHNRETCAPALYEHAQSTTLGLLVEASLFRLTGWFHSHLFFLLCILGFGVDDIFDPLEVRSFPF